MSFGAHLLAMLATPVHGAVALTYHDPIPVKDVPDRKTLARLCQQRVTQGYEEASKRTIGV